MTRLWNSFSRTNTSGIKGVELGGRETEAKADVSAFDVNGFELEGKEDGGGGREVDVDVPGEAGTVGDAAAEGLDASIVCNACKKSLRI